MRLRVLFWALAALVPIAACSGESNVAGDDARLAAMPTSVHCADAAPLRQRATDDRRQSEGATSDQAKVTVGNRANFFASLAVIADLKCKVTLVEADEALRSAFDAARKAEAASSFYEVAHRWGEASFIATHVVSLLTQQLPPHPPK